MGGSQEAGRQYPPPGSQEAGRQYPPPGSQEAGRQYPPPEVFLGTQEHPCLKRKRSPQSIGNLVSEPDRTIVCTTGICDSFPVRTDVTDHILAGDGSGGPDSKDPRTRVCSFGLACVKPIGSQGGFLCNGTPMGVHQALRPCPGLRLPPSCMTSESPEEMPHSFATTSRLPRHLSKELVVLLMGFSGRPSGRPGSRVPKKAMIPLAWFGCHRTQTFTTA